MMKSLQKYKHGQTKDKRMKRKEVFIPTCKVPFVVGDTGLLMRVSFLPSSNHSMNFLEGSGLLVSHCSLWNGVFFMRKQGLKGPIVVCCFFYLSLFPLNEIDGAQMKESAGHML